MIARIRTGVLAPLFLCLMAACGGGGGGSNNTPPPTGNNPPPPPTPAPTAEDIANARNSQLKANLRVDTKELTITWRDAFAAETGFTVEVREVDGSWQLLEALPPAANTNTIYTWQRIINASRTYRVRATRDTYSVPLEVSPDAPELPINLDSLPSIEIDQALPVSGPLQLTVANAVGASSVAYFIDANPNAINTSTAGPTFPFNLDARNYTDGNHLLRAFVRLPSGVSVELTRSIFVDNPTVAASLDVSMTSASSSEDRVIVSATVTARAGVQQLEFFVNGAPLRVLQGNDAYVFSVPTTELPGGTLVFRLVATDRSGNTGEATATIDIDTRPRLTVTSPANGTLVRDTLRLEGTFAEDVSTAVVTASLGNVQIMQLPAQTSGSFGIDYSLAGLPADEYTLTVSAQDSAGRTRTDVRRVILAPTQLIYEFVASNVAELLATDEGVVLYRKTDGSVVLRNAAGAETTLPIPANLSGIADWQLDGGYVVMSAYVPPASRHIFAFTPTGEVKNLSLQGGSTANGIPQLKRPWVMWLAESSANHFQIYNLDTDAVTVVSRPASALQLDGLSNFDMVTTSGAEQFLFTAQTGSVGPQLLVDVFRYNLQTQTTDVLTGGNSPYLTVQTDNSRLAWLDFGNQREILIAPVSNATAPTSLGPSLQMKPQLRDGWIVWIDPSYRIKANDGTATVDVGEAGNVRSVADGRVLFDDANGQLMIWTAAGVRRMLLRNLPIGAIHDGDVGFITTGTSESMLLYRISLP